jgi:hypothetical protein
VEESMQLAAVMKTIRPEERGKKQMPDINTRE